MLNFEAKPIIAMLHLKGNSDEEIMERMIKETEIHYRNGVDAVLVENYLGDTRNCVQALAYKSAKFAFFIHAKDAPTSLPGRARGG